MHFLTFSAWPRGIHAYPQTLSLSFKSSLLDYLASSKNWLNIQTGCSLNVLVKLRSRNLDSSSRPTLLPAAMGHTSYSLLVHRVAKPRADSAISYAFRLIWLCVRVFWVRIYYLQYDTADTHSPQKKLFGTLKTRRKLGRVFRKDFWEFYWGQEKTLPTHVSSNVLRNSCGTQFSTSPLLFSKVANCEGPGPSHRRLKTNHKTYNLCKLGNFSNGLWTLSWLLNRKTISS